MPRATGISPADYLGRTVVAGLPKKVRVGVINVSVAGCKIELFEKGSFQAYAATAPGLDEEFWRRRAPGKGVPPTTRRSVSYLKSSG